MSLILMTNALTSGDDIVTNYYAVSKSDDQNKFSASLKNLPDGDYTLYAQIYQEWKPGHFFYKQSNQVPFSIQAKS